MALSTIALSGLTEDDTAQVQACLDMPGCDWTLVDGAEADVLLVDIDSVWGHMDWLRATATGMNTIVYTSHDEVRNCDMLLQKPLQPKALKAFLDQLASQDGAPPADAGAASPKPAPTPTPNAVAAEPPQPTEPTRPAAAATTPDPAATPQPTPEPLPATLGASLLAGRIDHAVRVEAQGTVLQIDPERGGYHAPAMLKPLQALLDLPPSAAKPITPAAVEQLRLSPALPLTRLLWFAALCATPGRLSSSLDPNATYHLTRWPQIEREFPRHFRIATAMMKQPGTVEEVAAAASAPVGDVADFINAYSVAGYVGTESGDTPETPETSGASGMLSRFRKAIKNP